LVKAVEAVSLTDWLQVKALAASGELSPLFEVTGMLLS
jgi:hypothetical protein